MARMRILRLALAALMVLVACEGDTPRALPPSSTSPSIEASSSPSEAPSPAPTPEDTPSVASQRATVTRVVDGDTAVVSIAGHSERVRFIGVNTPESTTKHEPYGSEASAYTKRALTGKAVFLETDIELRDQYGRMLAYVWLAQPRSSAAEEVRASMFNARLLIDGYAQVATYPPNIKYADFFLPLQAEARNAKRGLWADARPQAQGGKKCDPSYPTVCIAPAPPDLDCGDIPYRRFSVVGGDPHGFDRDHDGIGCER
jgi:micrococcal nuclease